MFVNEFGILITENPYNLNKEKNINNIEKRAYNCGGYALGVFCWYLPYSKNNLLASSFSATIKTFGIEKTTLECVNYMLTEFSEQIRLINSIDELEKNEYAFAFRLGYDDFHYIKRNKNGNWYHKRGGSRYIERMCKKEVFSDCWCDEYSGPIYLFAKKDEN